MLSQQDNIDDVDIERISQNSFDVAQDMLDNETEDNTNSRPELELSEMDDMEKSKRNVRNIEIDNDADAKNDPNDDNALFVSQTSQAEHDLDVDEINEGIYMQIKTKFGTLNRSTFKKKIENST
ncbi:hypothetical protein ACJMK2_039167 [Sinanodonta woodiana]|uniref:Uncharacterized protein n=1 Tax=Sinanodonta woodiana TaxID=1069815 RepID=A0ABD3WF32_SINWO